MKYAGGVILLRALGWLLALKLLEALYPPPPIRVTGSPSDLTRAAQRLLGDRAKLGEYVQARGGVHVSDAKGARRVGWEQSGD